jgi:putative transcription antitermination factor YqgF
MRLVKAVARKLFHEVKNLVGFFLVNAFFSRAFAKNIEDLGLPILLRDERWSTQAVERDMIAADMSRAKRAEKIDSGAAAFILQGAIDALTSG